MTDVFLFLIAIMAGVLNALAGGGSFITLPALLYVGVSPTAANATSATSLLPGYASSLHTFRKELVPPVWLGTAGLVVLAGTGGVAGAVLLLLTGDAIFANALPWLMAFATLMAAIAPRLRQMTLKTRGIPPLALGAGLFAACVYGGYFNGGAGIVIIALLNLQAGASLLQSVATKTLFSVVMGSLSVLTYILSGAVQAHYAVLMAVGAAIGGVIGARIGRLLPEFWHRSVIVVIGLAMTVFMFVRS